MSLQSNTKLLTGYLRPEDDRCCDVDGTFRIYVPETRSSRIVVHNGQKENSLAYIAAVFVGGTQHFAEEQIRKPGSCDRAVDIKSNTKLKIGFDAWVLGIESSGEGKVEWKKPAGEVEQFASQGRRDDLLLIIHGIAKCDGREPAYLEEADVVIGNPENTKGGFSIASNGFFEGLEDDPVLKRLKKEDSNINVTKNRPLSQMIVVPKVAGADHSIVLHAV